AGLSSFLSSAAVARPATARTAYANTVPYLTAFRSIIFATPFVGRPRRRQTPAGGRSPAGGGKARQYISKCSLIYQALTPLFDYERFRVGRGRLARGSRPLYTGPHGSAQDDFRRRRASHRARRL